VTVSNTVRDLGVTDDAELSMKNRVHSVAQRSVPTDAMQHTRVHTFTASCIDYCNYVLWGHW